MKKAIIVGAGPAGLTAAYELLEKSDEYQVTVFEESDILGGISKTVEHNGNRMDMGGHRFFSKVDEVNKWWEKMMPSQGAPSFDDIKLNKTVTLKEGGADPEQTDRVMLKRHRLSRIFFKGKFFDYPISLKPETIKNMGVTTTAKVGVSYMASMAHKRDEDSLENFYINRFGKELYSMFFEHYTENLWGRHPRDISAEWGAQRVKGLSITAVLRDVAQKAFKKDNRKVETSLIEEFSYPKLGPGQLWELTGEEVEKMGGTILKNSRVVEIIKDDSNNITGVVYENDGNKVKEDCDILISSMPLKDLVGDMNGVPENIGAIAAGLPYRDYMTVGVLVPSLKLKNETDIKTLGAYVPDDWVYVHDRRVKMGRFQIYNNWSPYLVKDAQNTVWLGLEYFCNEGDELWNMDDEDFANLAFSEMVTVGLIGSVSEVLDHHVERVKKAYPAYFDTYDKIDELRAYLDTIPNLYCVGRNGQHRYNNLDHSMCTSFEAVKNILSGKTDKSNIWSVNTEKEYHEGEGK
ncbi:MAG: NAD(P)/FAD-dependent oxidoreductase [Eubacterium sp.]|nr:NAD(P)/FAD-dependent oxidoreductase [Eubacterium sp.]